MCKKLLSVFLCCVVISTSCFPMQQEGSKGFCESLNNKKKQLERIGKFGKETLKKVICTCSILFVASFAFKPLKSNIKECSSLFIEKLKCGDVSGATQAVAITGVSVCVVPYLLLSVWF